MKGILQLLALLFFCLVQLTQAMHPGMRRERARCDGRNQCTSSHKLQEVLHLSQCAPYRSELEAIAQQKQQHDELRRRDDDSGELKKDFDWCLQLAGGFPKTIPGFIRMTGQVSCCTILTVGVRNVPRLVSHMHSLGQSSEWEYSLLDRIAEIVRN